MLPPVRGMQLCAGRTLSYVFFTASCVVDEPVHELHLGHAFESTDAEQRALSRRFFDVAWDGEPDRTIRVRPKSLWEPLRRWLRARAIAVYWFELTARLYAPGGVGRKRDREEFEAEMRALRIL